LIKIVSGFGKLGIMGFTSNPIKPLKTLLCFLMTTLFLKILPVFKFSLLSNSKVFNAVFLFYLNQLNTLFPGTPLEIRECPIFPLFEQTVCAR
jgi:hypothetical protein